MAFWLWIVLVTSIVLSLLSTTHCEEKKSGVYTFWRFNSRQKFREKTVTFEDVWSNVSNFSKSILDIITNPIKQVFAKESEHAYGIEEHGRLASPARDVIRGVSNVVDKAIDKIDDTLGFKKSNETCGLDSDKGFFTGVADKFKDTVRAIYPGTNWCGDGNRAENYEELGEFSKTDNCCREHDNCPVSIPAGETRFGLVNTGLFTRSHCSCDSQFYECLKEADSIVSKQIGTTYFTVLGPQCFKQDFEIVRCIKSEWGKCIHYETCGCGEQIYQWFDSPNF